jgi:hypothetical protein
LCSCCRHIGVPRACRSHACDCDHGCDAGRPKRASIGCSIKWMDPIRAPKAAHRRKVVPRTANPCPYPYIGQTLDTKRICSAKPLKSLALPSRIEPLSPP